MNSGIAFLKEKERSVVALNMNHCRKTIKRLIIFIFTASMTLTSPAPSAEGVGMVTGPSTGTYIQFGKQIAEISKTEGVEIIVKKSEGSVENIQRLMSTENAAFAIVQSDVLGHLKKSKNLKMRKIADKLRMIFPFYNEEIHLFAKRSIKNIDDLNGKKVVIGSDRSGTNMTAENLLAISNVEPGKRIYESPKKGVIQVLQGQADAVFYVSGKPVELFINLFKADDVDVKEKLSKLHFVPLNEKSMLAEYVKADITPNDYSIVRESIPTVAVKAMLVGFDFSNGSTPYYKQRCQQLRKIGIAIRSNMNYLQEQGHPKWKTVNLDDSVGKWKKDSCSHPDTVESLSLEANLAEQKLTCILEGGRWRNNSCQN